MRGGQRPAAAEAGEIGGLARGKSFFQKTLEAARGVFWRGLEARGEDWIPAEHAGMARGVRRDVIWRGLGRSGAQRLDARWPGQTGGAALGGSGVVGRGWQEGEGTEGKCRKAWHEWGQGERGEAGGHRRRAKKDGEQAQRGRDQAQEACEQQEQKRGGGHLEIGLRGLLG